MRLSRFRTVLFSLLSFLVVASCVTDIKNLDNPLAQRAILERAESYLTSGLCDSALETLQPLLTDTYASYGSRLLESSAYACRGGLNFPTLIAALADGGSDIWSSVVKANYSTGSDGKTNSLVTAADRICKTAEPAGAGVTAASGRTEDANAYMIFVQMNVIGTVIAPLGNANSTTGKRTQPLNCAASCSAAQRCRVQVAFAHMFDSINYVGGGSAMTKVSTSMNTACQVALAGACPSNKDYDTCISTAAYQTQGENLINAIEAGWSL